MAQHIIAHGTYILGDDVATALHEGIGASSQCQIDRSTGRSTEGNERLEILQSIVSGLTRSEDDIHDVALDLFIDIDLGCQTTQLQDISDADDGVDLLALGTDLLADDLSLFLLLGVRDQDLEHEAVYLSFGEGVRTFLLDGVLRRHDEEGIGELEGLITDGHLMLLHGLKQGALHLSWGTVDFVREDEVREDRSLLHREVLLLLAVH